MKNHKIATTIGIFIFIFLIATSSFLVSQQNEYSIEDFITEGEINCIEDYANIEFEKEGLKAGSIVFKEDCLTDLSKITGISELSLGSGKGVTDLSREKDTNRFVLKVVDRGERIVKIKDQEFILEKGDTITFNEGGEILQAKFSSAENQKYGLGVVSFSSATGGKVDFDLDKRFLSLPENSVLEDFDSDFSDLSLEKFTKGMIVEGQNIRISDNLFEKMFSTSDFPKEFQKFSGKLGFKKTLPREKDLPEKYFSFLVQNEKVSFPEAKINFEGRISEIPIIFGGERFLPGTISEGKTSFGNEKYTIDRGKENYNFISLGKSEFFINSVSSEKASPFTLTFEEDSDYAGFKLGKGEFLSFSPKIAQVSVKHANFEFFDSNPSFIITNGEDQLVRDFNKLNLDIGGGEEGAHSTNFGADIFGQKKTFRGIRNTEKEIVTFTFGSSIDPAKINYLLKGDYNKILNIKEGDLIPLGTGEYKYLLLRFSKYKNYVEGRSKQLR